MNVLVTTKLQALVVYIGTEFPGRREKPISDILKLPFVERWIHNVGDGIFADEFDLNVEDGWILTLLHYVQEEDVEVSQPVIYKRTDQGRLVVYSAADLKEESAQYLDEGVGIDDLDDDQMEELITSLGAESFNFKQYLEEVLAEAGK